MDSLYLKLLPVFFVVSGLVKAVPVTVGWVLGRTRLAERWRIYRRSLAPGQLRSEARAAVGVVLCDTLLITAFRAAFESQMALFSVGATLLTFAWMFVGFEVWFYVSHRLLHTRALYRFHALHHARYQGHYGLFTPILDRWLGTAFDDYVQVHGLARAGRGLERIGERVRSAKQPAPLAPTSTSAPGTA